MVDPKSDVYTATYSGIQVFEMSVGDCTLMRRRSDSYLNATQILKLGGFDKGKRTKILEREVLPKTHEKIQGGYGKYQGTWVPLEIGRDLAERYDVLHLLLPLLDFDTSIWGDLPEKEQMPPRNSRTRINHGHPSQPHSQPLATQPDQLTASGSLKRKTIPLDNEENDPSRIEASPSNLPIPLALPSTPINAKKKPRIQAQPKQKQPQSDIGNDNKGNEGSKGNTNSLASPARSTVISKKDDGNDMDTEQNRNILLSIFSSDDDIIPSFFYGAGATTGIDWDISIDEQGHTALHWSVSLGWMHTVEWLIAKGANVVMVNSVGETPLMRGVMATLVYDHDCFPQMLDILGDSLSLVDYTGRTVLHHIILSTMESKTTANLDAISSSTSSSSNARTISKVINPPSPLVPMSTLPSSSSTQLSLSTSSAQPGDRLLAAKSYMTQVLKVICQHNEHLHILSQPDITGETPYCLARRLNCMDLCHLLVQSGCSLPVQDSLSENNAPSLLALPPPIPEKQTEPSKRSRKKAERKHDKPDSQAGDLISTVSSVSTAGTVNTVNTVSTKGQELVSTVQRIVDSMDVEFNNKLQAKEADISRLQQEIRDLTRQIEEAHHQQQSNETKEADRGQLERANLKIKQLEDILGKSEIKGLEIGTTYASNNTKSQLSSSTTSTSTTRDNEMVTDREKQLEHQIRLLQLQLMESNNGKLQDTGTLIQTHADTLESLAACKRLIAVCCNLPLEKVDDFIGPLTLAIENDPPDLDFARVIGFMEKLRQHQQ